MVSQLLHMKDITLVEIHHQLVKAYKGSVMSWKQVLTQHTIFNIGRTDVDKSSHPDTMIIPYRCSFLRGQTYLAEWHLPKARYFTGQHT
jgi:hypothetical protein